MEWKCSDVSKWREAVRCYKGRMTELDKPNLASLDEFYSTQLPITIANRNPNPYITTSELSSLMRWKLTRGKWRPRLLDFVSSLDEALVKSVSQKAFKALPDISKAVTELTTLKGVGPATASAILAAYAPDIAPFMSDEAMVAALGNSKDYTLKQYLKFVDKLQSKAKELSKDGDVFTPSDVERALWSCAIGANLSTSSQQTDLKGNSAKTSQKKRKRRLL